MHRTGLQVLKALKENVQASRISKSDLTKVNSFYDINPDFDYKDIFQIKSGFAECMDNYLEHRYEYDAVYFPNDFMFCSQNHSRIFQAIKCVFLFDKSLNLVSCAPMVMMN